MNTLKAVDRWRFLRYVLFLTVIAIAGLFLHEGGHGIAAAAFGGKITYFEVAWIAALFLPLDIITYSFFPALGLRHWIIVGGKVPEPLLGAMGLGISQTVFYIVLVLVNGLFYSMLGFKARVAGESPAARTG